MPIVAIKVRPNAGASRLTAQPDGSYLAEIKAAPVDGKANEELVRLVARHFGCPRSHVSVKLGGSSRNKLVAVSK